MEFLIQTIVTVACSIMASSGFWAFVTYKGNKKNANNELLVGLGHDRIVSLGMMYIDRGHITKDEYENLHDYLYVPYEKAGGNGSAKRVMTEVEKLEIRNM